MRAATGAMTSMTSMTSLLDLHREADCREWEMVVLRSFTDAEWTEILRERIAPTKASIAECERILERRRRNERGESSILENMGLSGAHRERKAGAN